MWSSTPAGHIDYEIKVKTGDKSGAGTDAAIKIKLIGETSETEFTTLDVLFRNDFEQGRIDDFKVKMADVGRPLLCVLDIKEWGYQCDWMVDYIKVSCHGKNYLFSIYEWVCDQYTAAEASLCFARDYEIPKLKEFREKFLEGQAKLFRWATPEEQPYKLTGHLVFSSYDELPRNHQWGEDRNNEFAQTVSTAKNNIKLNKVLASFRSVNRLHDVNRLLMMPGMKSRPLVKACWDSWKDDKEFARQMINGSRPRGIERVFEMPDTCIVTDQDVAGLIPEGCTLASEIEKGRLFMVDNRFIAGTGVQFSTVWNTQLYSCSPIMLFYCNEEGYLMPIAIQLFGGNGEEGNPIWTPKDSPDEWLLAKVFAYNANGQIQQMCDHLLLCHMISEPFTIALFRNLMKTHPLYSILVEHLNQLISVNTHARTSLINNGGQVDLVMSLGGGGHVEMMQRCLKKFSMTTINLPKQLKIRGLDDENMIKEFALREDGTKYWNAIDEYVSSVFNHFYENDQAVEDDVDVQNFIKDVKAHGFNNCDDPEIPDTIDSIAQLTLLVTSIIFVGSAQHASEGNGMFDIYGNPANASFALRQPAPKEKGKVTEKRILETLPTEIMMTAQIGIVYATSAIPDNESYLGEFNMEQFGDTVKPFQEKIRERIKEIGKEIDERNKHWSVPLKYTHPENVACRIDY